MHILQGTPSRENDSGYGIRGGLKAFHSANELTELSVSPPRLPPQPSPPGHKRKFAQVQSHSQFRLVSESKLPPAPRSQGEEINTTPSTYILFQLCALVSSLCILYVLYNIIITIIILFIMYSQYNLISYFRKIYS